MVDPVAVNQGIAPNHALLWVGETSTSYLSLENDSVWKGALKVASYVLTLGILPAIAAVSANVYRRVQARVYQELCRVAETSFDGSLWVLNNLDRFRIKHSMSSDTRRDIQGRVKILQHHPKVDLLNHIYFAVLNNPQQYVKLLNAGQIKNWATQLGLSKTDCFEVFRRVSENTSTSINDLKKESDEKNVHYSPYTDESLDSFGICKTDMVGLLRASSVLTDLAAKGIVPSLAELRKMMPANNSRSLDSTKEDILKAMLKNFKMPYSSEDLRDHYEFDRIIHVMEDYQIETSECQNMLTDYLSKTRQDTLPVKDPACLKKVHWTQK